MLAFYKSLHPAALFSVPLWSFMIIGIGGLSCVIGGYISERISVKRTALTALSLSCLCCLISPLAFLITSQAIFLAFLLIWGMVVIADSPLFSTLVAQNAIAENKGTALTIVNCIGFSITIISIQLLNILQLKIDTQYIFLVLAIGPILGLLAARTKRTSHD